MARKIPDPFDIDTAPAGIYIVTDVVAVNRAHPASLIKKIIDQENQLASFAQLDLAEEYIEEVLNPVDKYDELEKHDWEEKVEGLGGNDPLVSYTSRTKPTRIVRIYFKE